MNPILGQIMPAILLLFLDNPASLIHMKLRKYKPKSLFSVQCWNVILPIGKV